MATQDGPWWWLWLAGYASRGNSAELAGPNPGTEPSRLVPPRPVSAGDGTASGAGQSL